MLYWTLPINGNAVYTCGKKLCQCASIPDNAVLTQIRKENVGLRVTQMCWFRVLLFPLHVGAHCSKEESHNPCNSTSQDVTDVLCQMLAHSKILAFWNLLIKVALLWGINPTQKCVDAHKHQTYSYLFLITCVFKHAKLSVLLFPFKCIYLKIWLSIRKRK